MLADYDSHRPNEIFAERGTEWLTLDDAYTLQRAVAQLRVARGERSLGYKVGCLSSSVQEQLAFPSQGEPQPVRKLRRFNAVLQTKSKYADWRRNCKRTSNYISLSGS